MRHLTNDQLWELYWRVEDKKRVTDFFSQLGKRLWGIRDRIAMEQHNRLKDRMGWK